MAEPPITQPEAPPHQRRTAQAPETNRRAKRAAAPPS